MAAKHALVGSGAAGIAGLIAAAGGSCSANHRGAEFGWLRGSLLEADSSPGVLIPAHADSPGGWRALSMLDAGASLTSSTVVADHGGHAHTLPDVSALVDGARVLLLWVGQSPVVLGVI